MTDMVDRYMQLIDTISEWDHLAERAEALLYLLRKPIPGRPDPDKPATLQEEP